MSDSEVDGERLQLERLWCLQQVETQLESGKLSEKKVKEARQARKLLRQANTPLVRLRQAMRVACPDYREKMRAEEKEVKLGGERIVAAEVKSVKSNFIKRAKSSDSTNTSITNEKVEFKFNFNIDT